MAVAYSAVRMVAIKKTFGNAIACLGITGSLKLLKSTLTLSQRLIRLWPVLQGQTCNNALVKANTLYLGQEENGAAG